MKSDKKKKRGKALGVKGWMISQGLCKKDDTVIGFVCKMPDYVENCNGVIKK